MHRFHSVPFHRFLTVLLPGLLWGTFCKPGPPPDALVVLFASPASILLRGGEEFPARSGVVLRLTDVLQTGDGSLDLQSRNGVTVRLRPFTSVRLTDLQGSAAGSSRLEVIHGSLLARIPQTPRQKKFAVITPTVAVESENAAFAVTIENGRRPWAKVLEGSVAFAPRLAALETKEVDSPAVEEGAELIRVMQAAGIVLMAGDEASLKPTLDLRLRTIAAGLETNQDVTGEIRAATAAIRKDLGQPKPPVRRVSPGLSLREESERLILFSIRRDVLERAANQDDAERAAASIEKSYNERLDNSIRLVITKLSGGELNSREAIAREYGALERIRLSGGETVTGAVAARAGGTLIIHTPEGVFRKNRSELEIVDFPGK